MTKSICRYDKAIDRLCKKVHPKTDVLRQVQGVGPLTSLSFVLAMNGLSHGAVRVRSA